MSTGSVPLASVSAGLSARRDALLAAWLEGMVPGFAIRAGYTPALTGLQTMAEAALDAILHALGEGRAVNAGELGALRPRVRHAVLHGIPEAEILRCCRLAHPLLWEQAETDPVTGRDALIALTRLLFETVETLSAVCAETFAETSEAIALSADQQRRRLVEGLIAGEERDPVLARVAAGCGLGTGATYVVLVARAVGGAADEAQASLVGTALSRAAGAALAPPFACLPHETVCAVPVVPDGVAAFVAAVRTAREQLADQGLEIRIGLSAARSDPAAGRAAYREAVIAVEIADGRRPVVALPLFGAFGYLVLRAGDSTAWGLIRPAVRELIDDPAQEARDLVATLLAFVECDASVKRAAARLHVHTNTAHHRLGKLRERTGLDPRSLSDLAEFFVAVSLAEATGRIPSSAHQVRGFSSAPR